MGHSMTIHAGHGPYPGGAYGAVGYLNESVEARKVVLELKKYLKFEDITDNNPAHSANQVLRTITAAANAEDREVNFSIHLNAAKNTSAQGLEILYYPTQENKEICQRMLRYIKQVMPDMPIHGSGLVPRANLYILRNTKARTFIIECAYVTNISDARNWDAEDFAEKFARVVKMMYSNAGASADKEEEIKPPTGVETEDGTVKNMLYKVQLGAFADKENADTLASILRSKGYDCYVKKE